MVISVEFSCAIGADAGLLPPKRATKGAAGYDLSANFPESERVILLPMQRALVPTGLILAMPITVEGQIRPRSGLALKHGLTIPNSPGTIDSDFRGEIKVILHNLGEEPVEITHGMRIAQLVFAPVLTVDWQGLDNLDATARSSGGFGSTGTI